VIDKIVAADTSHHELGASVDGANSAEATVINDDTLIGLRAEAHQLVEGDSGTSEMRFYIDDLGHSDTSPAMADITVNYEITGSTDQNDFSTPITASGVHLQYDADHGYYVALQLNGDTDIESDEVFNFRLTGANGPTSGGVEISSGQDKAAATILTDDTGLQIVSTTTEALEDRARFTFDVLRGGAISEAMDVTWRIGNVDVNGEALAGVSANDFIDPATGQAATAGLTGTVHFDAGQTTGRFVVETTHDFTPELDEAIAKRYRALFDVYKKYAGTITAVMNWNVTDASSWLRHHPTPHATWPLLFDADGKPKAAFWALSKP
jgi:hypothetical protein